MLQWAWCVDSSLKYWFQFRQIYTQVLDGIFFFMCGVKKRVQFHSFALGYPVSQHHLLKGLSFLHSMFLAPRSNVSWLYIHRFISWLYSVPLVYVLVDMHYHPVLINIDMQCSLKLASVMFPSLSLFLRIVLAIEGLLWFQTKRRRLFFYWCEWDCT